MLLFDRFHFRAAEYRLLRFSGGTGRPTLKIYDESTDDEERPVDVEEPAGGAQAENEQLLRAEKGKPQPKGRKETLGTIALDKQKAVNRIKKADASPWYTKWNNFTTTSDKLLDKELSALAKKRAKQTGDRIRELGTDAESALADRASADENSLVVLEQKVVICDEVIRDLQEEIDACDTDRDEYLAAAKLVGTLKKDLDSKELKQIKTTKAKMVQRKTEAVRAVKAAENKRGVKEVGEAHTRLLHLLQKASPGFPGIERMIVDNVGHTGYGNSELMEFINELQKDDKIDTGRRDILLKMANKLRLQSGFSNAVGIGGLVGKEHKKNLAQYYTTLMSKTVNTETMDTKALMEYLYSGITPGKTLMVGGRRLTILKQESADLGNGKSKRVIRLITEDGNDAVIDPGAGILSIEDAKGNFRHMTLEKRALKAGDDLTMVHLASKELRSVEKKKVVAEPVAVPAVKKEAA